jgi:hypothetical protein
MDWPISVRTANTASSFAFTAMLSEGGTELVELTKA